jgi:uncharacterized protein (UPF0332 family)
MKYPVEIKSHLDGALSALQGANEALDKGQNDAATSHAFEAAFHTGSTLLLDEEIEPSKHGDVITLIQQIFVEGRRLTKEQGANLGWLFALGKAEQGAGAMPVSYEEAHKAVQIAESFFEAAKVILEA